MTRRSLVRIARNVRPADMNLELPVADARRAKIVANGLPLWYDCQLATDISPRRNSSCACSPGTRPPPPDQQRSRPGSRASPGSSSSLSYVPMPPLCWNCRSQKSSVTVSYPSYTRSWSRRTTISPGRGPSPLGSRKKTKKK